MPTYVLRWVGGEDDWAQLSAVRGARMVWLGFVPLLRDEAVLRTARARGQAVSGGMRQWVLEPPWRQRVLRMVAEESAAPASV